MEPCGTAPLSFRTLEQKASVGRGGRNPGFQAKPRKKALAASSFCRRSFLFGKRDLSLCWKSSVLPLCRRDARATCLENSAPPGSTRSDRIASEQPPFNPLTRSNQQIRRACLEIYRGQSRHTLLAALQSHSISRSSLCLISPPTPRPAGTAGKVNAAPLPRVHRRP